MKDRIKLPFIFNPKALKEDLRKIELNCREWTSHYVQNNYEGSWSLIPLRANKGVKHPILLVYADPTSKEFENTPYIENCHYFQEVLNTFQCNLQTARLMKLTSGSEIKEHRDLGLDFEEGNIRIHIPIITNSEVYFYLNGERVIMNEGECWYLKLSEPHRVQNLGQDRIHLVIDMEVNDWVKEQLFANA